MKYSIFAFSLLLAGSAIGVSRIGGGKIASSSSQFELDVAAPFTDLQEFQQVVMAEGPFGFTNNQMTPQFIQVREFQSHFESLKDKSRAETAEFFSTAGWDNLPGKDCVDAYTYTNDTATSTVLTWGSGKGVILEGPATPMVRYAIEQSLATLQIAPGACAWK